MSAIVRDPYARVIVVEEGVRVVTVGTQGPPGPPSLDVGDIVAGDLGTEFVPQATPGVPGVPGWREAPWRNLNDWPRLGGETDDVARFQRALDDPDTKYLLVQPAPGESTLYVPLDTDTLVDPTKTIQPHSGQVIKGLGRRGVILCPSEGVDVSAAVFEVLGTETVRPRDIVFENLEFIGDNGADEAGFTYVLNNTANAIWMRGGDWSMHPEDITVRGCRFRHLWGFSVHSAGENHRCSIVENTMRFCANGINVQGDGVLIAHNQCYEAEGVEITGERYRVINNTFENCYQTGVSAGGHSGEPSGIVVAENTIYGKDGENVTGIGIYGVVGAVVAGNTVSPAGTGYGFEAGGDFLGTRPAHCSIAGNTFEADRISGPVMHAWTEDCAYTGNTVRGNSNLAVEVDGARNAFSGNVFDVGSTTGRAIQFTADAVDTLIDASNQYAPFAWFGSGGSFRDGSFLRLTTRPTAAALWRGVTLAVRGGSGVADTLERCEKDAAGGYAWRPVTQGQSSHGTASVADGGTIAHGLGVTPGWVGLTPKVGGRIAVVAGLTSTNITIDLKDHAGTDIAVAEDVLWRAEV